MPVQRSCSICGFYRQRTDGTPAVFRYGLSRQVAGHRVDGSRTRAQRIYAGSLDLCDECIDRLAAPNMRPELRGRTGPKALRAAS